MQKIDHSWDLAPQEAIALQRSLQKRLIIEDRFDSIQRVAGVDVGFEDRGAVTRAAVAVLTYPALQVVETRISRRPTTFPYVPGLLSFREIPAVLEALAQVKLLPDMLLCDGQGIAHPRRMGIAAHLGLIVDIPSIGVGKSRLFGTHGRVPEERGGWTPLRDGNEIIGAVLRTRARVKPLFISPGHRVGLPAAIECVMNCTTHYRLPETTRFAHQLASGPAYD